MGPIRTTRFGTSLRPPGSTPSPRVSATSGTRMIWRCSQPNQSCTTPSTPTASTPPKQANAATPHKPKNAKSARRHSISGRLVQHRSCAAPVRICGGLALVNCRLQARKRFAHHLKMRMLASAHALAFRALQGIFINLPGLQDGDLLGYRYVARLDDVHWTSKCAGRIELGSTDILLVVHVFLLRSCADTALRELFAKHRFSSLP